MKVTKIELEDFHQFKDVVIDLTYPKGHKQEGKPLEKVCIIGQSGTGKTTLLKLLKGFLHSAKQVDEEYGILNIQDNIYMEIALMDLAYKITLGPKPDDEPNSSTTKYIKSLRGSTLRGELLDKNTTISTITNLLSKIATHLIYIPADMSITQADFAPSSLPFNNEKKYFDFSETKIGDTWQKILADIQTYQEKEIKIRQGISKLVDEGADPSEVDEALQELRELKKKEFNPLKQIAENCLNPILKNFNLRVKTELDFQKKDDIGFIKIEDLNGNEIPNGLLSTGTKQIILSALPLYLLEPNQTIILYDEPERSLYPNIQRLVVDFYTSLTTDSQFFFATHSPIIASCFEPWEIVELKFNKEGYVYQELYYPEGAERHVDNYNIIPAYLTYDLILREVFDVEETTSYERSEKITEVLMLRDQLKRFKEEKKSKTPEAQKVYTSYKKLAGQLFWDFETA